MKSRRGLIIGLLLAIVGLCGLACAAVAGLVIFAPVAYQAMLSSSSLQVGETAPDFELTTIDGQTVSLSEFRGTPVLLTLGATWCPDCRREAPLLQAVHERRSDLIILMIDS